MGWKSKAITAALTSKGFQVENGKEKYFRFYCDGKATHVLTHISHGNDEYELDGGVLQGMKRQLHLTSKQLSELLNCPLDKPQYVAILIQKEVLTH